MDAIKGKRVAGWSAAAIMAIVGVMGYGGYRLQREKPGSVAWKKAERRSLSRLAAWPEKSKALGALLVERFGPPDSLGQDEFTWTDRHPWKRITVRRIPSESIIEHVIAYDVPPENVDAVRAMGHSVAVDTVRGEISARGGSESLNFLTLNLADEVAKGTRSPEQARDFYAKTAALAEAGKSSPYMEGPLIKPQPRAVQEWDTPGFRF